MDFSSYKLNIVPSKDDATPIYIQKETGRNEKPFPSEYILSNIPPVMNQGSIGSCVGVSGYTVVHSLGLLDEYPSALWIYHNGKRYDIMEGENYSGTTIVGACIGLTVSGCCSQSQIPYVTTEVFEFTNESIDWASKNKMFSYYKINIDDINSMMDVLYNKKRSLWVAFYVSQQFFEIKKDGILYEDGYDMVNFKGGHAVAIIGWKYIDGRLFWICRNSYGPFFGDNGNFYIEHSLLLKIIYNNGSYVGVLDANEMPDTNVQDEYIKNANKNILSKFLSWIRDTIGKVFKR